MSPTDKTKILLLDDESFLLELYALRFLKSGYDVFTTRSVDEALKILRGGYVPAVILFDITMPEKNGYQFLEGLSALPVYASALKVALTNEGQDGALHHLGELGADAHILKAKYTPAEVVEQVNALLAARQSPTAPLYPTQS